MILNQKQRETLLQVARDSIRNGLEQNRPLPLEQQNFEAPLTDPGASFVTLKIDEKLRGCMGSLEAYTWLAEDVSKNAYSSAFEDPRFPSLVSEEEESLQIHISVLSPPAEVHFESEEELLQLLRPGVDGLILEEGRHRSTFLPSVWESLPGPVSFLRHLKRKAGLDESYWSSSLRIYRYTTESFS